MIIVELPQFVLKRSSILRTRKDLIKGYRVQQSTSIDYHIDHIAKTQSKSHTHPNIDPAAIPKPTLRATLIIDDPKLQP